MKKLLLIFIIVGNGIGNVVAQGNGNDYMRDLYIDRAKNNLEILSKNDYLKKYVNISNAGIELFSSANGSKPEFTLYWFEATDFLKKFHKYSYQDMKRFYDAKGSQRLRLSFARRTTDFWRFTPDKIDELAVAIDPGHFAGSWSEAVQEKKYIKVKGSEVGQQEDIKFYEAQLNMATALLLKDTLEKLNVRKVMITRKQGESAVGKPFNEWFKEDFETDTKKLAERGEIPSGLANRLLKFRKPYDAFKYVYSYLDFVNRSRSINAFRPDITLVMHYNADEEGKRKEGGYWPVTDKNFSMVFTPGAFLNNELLKKDARIEFLRLLLSPDLEESNRLAGFIVDEFNERLGVAPVSNDIGSKMLSKVCNFTGKEGVYARNLYLTRAIESPVCYVEALLQDSKEEVVALSDTSVEIGELQTSKRVQEVAYAYLASLQDWMDDNKKLQAEWNMTEAK